MYVYAVCYVSSVHDLYYCTRVLVYIATMHSIDSVLHVTHISKLVIVCLLHRTKHHMSKHKEIIKLACIQNDFELVSSSPYTSNCMPKILSFISLQHPCSMYILFCEALEYILHSENLVPKVGIPSDTHLLFQLLFKWHVVSFK